MRALVAALVVVLAPALAAAGDEPPAGSPWHRTCATAVQSALAKAQVVFVDFTKTYGPACGRRRGQNRT